MGVKTYSIVVEIEIDDDPDFGEQPSLTELKKETSRMVSEYFAAEVVDIEAAEGTLEDAFGIEEAE